MAAANAFRLSKFIKSSSLNKCSQYIPTVIQGRCLSTKTHDDPIEGADRKTVTLIPGDGVGPEVAAAVKHVFNSCGVPVDFDEVVVHDTSMYDNTDEQVDRVMKSMEKTRVGLKGALLTPTSISGHGHLALNQRLALGLDLFANVIHCKTLPGIKTRHPEIDMVVIREQTEGEYTSLEHESVSGVVEMIKVITEVKSERIARYAFDFATKNNRKKVTCVHKANIMKKGDGLFLDTCTQVSKRYPKIQFEQMIVDNTAMQLVSNPTQFDVMVLPNLYGSIVDNIGAGLVGGPGVVPGRSFGSKYAFFEPGARHTFSAGAGRNVANPTAMLLSACDMLDHIHLRQKARLIRKAIHRTIAEQKYLTMDMGGHSSASIYVNRIIQNVRPEDATMA